VEDQPLRIISWNLWHRAGAVLADLVALIEDMRPDLLLMQEAKKSLECLPESLGGHFHWQPLPRRIYGLGAWTPHRLAPPGHLRLPASRLPGRVPPRYAQLLVLRGITFANVHLSHGQILNRRQLKAIAEFVSGPIAIIGDYNAVGRISLPGFQDPGPRGRTHMLRTRLDRCMTRGLTCSQARILGRGPSDHHPIEVDLARPNGSSPT
jgi:endonuclease/exonuclease/phosphatase (EEP) superfamily protein YafD